MSETDDTDVLLLIPPDFFLVRSSGSEESLLESSRTVVHKPQSCTAQVLGKLVGQVHSLESRLESLEISSTITDTSLGTFPRRKTSDTDSFESHSVDRKSFTFPRRRRRKTKRHISKDISLTSLDSKSIPPLKLRDFEVVSIESKTEVNESTTMDGDLSSIVSTPNKKTDKLLLHEIDEFLTKVESYEGPESKFKDDNSPLNSESVIKAAGEYISHKLDNRSTSEEIKLPSGRTVSSTVLDKYIYLVKNNPGSQINKNEASTSSYRQNDECSKPCSSEYTKTSEDLKKIQEKSPSIRKLNFIENKDIQPTSTPKKPAPYTDSFNPTSNKIYERASKVLEQYKSQSYNRNTHSMTDSYLLKEDFKLPQMRPYVHDAKDVKLQNKLMESIDTDLLSLSELWGDRGDRAERGDSVRLEEERLKREHCESMIQQLQKKLLEQQEKLAVAIRVDRAKDAAITKLREAWLRLTGSLDRAEERHRGALDKMVREIENFKTVADESQKKTNHFETELYKALDLAHDYQEKCKHLTNDMKQVRGDADQAAASHRDVITGKDREIQVLKESYETVMRLNKQSTDCAKNLEDALEKEKSDHELTKGKVTELHRKVQSASDDTSIVAQERDVLREKVNEERARGNMLERQLAEKQNQVSELLKKCDTQDNEVKSLRKHLELQKSELKSHYQKQLEDAVLGKLQEFQQQLEIAEREMENDARGKENAIVDTYNKQMARIEEQHRLEVSLLEEKQREEMKLSRLQLAQANEKIGLLESKLCCYRRRRGELASQLHGVMEAQWRQALLILTAGHGPTDGSSMDITRPHTAVTPSGQDYGPPKIPPLTLPHQVFERRARRPARGGGGDGGGEGEFNFEGLSDNELQQYVKLLLTKPPTLDASGDSAPPRTECHEEPTSDRPDTEHRDKLNKRSLNASKPPWKA